MRIYWNQYINMNKCWICGKEKGQPPERCNGHYQKIIQHKPRIPVNYTLEEAQEFSTFTTVEAEELIQDFLRREKEILYGTTSEKENSSNEESN
jgi:hypothetical protein